MLVINKEINALQQLCTRLDEERDCALKRKMSPVETPENKRRRLSTDSAGVDNDALDLSFRSDSPSADDDDGAGSRSVQAVEESIVDVESDSDAVEVIASDSEFKSAGEDEDDSNRNAKKRKADKMIATEKSVEKSPQTKPKSGPQSPDADGEEFWTSEMFIELVLDLVDLSDQPSRQEQNKCFGEVMDFIKNASAERRSQSVKTLAKQIYKFRANQQQTLLDEWRAVGFDITLETHPGITAIPTIERTTS
jgi:hypothetical protein